MHRLYLHHPVQGLSLGKQVRPSTLYRTNGNRPGETTGPNRLERASVRMGCIWDSEAPRAPSAPVRLRTPRLLAVHRALTTWAKERGVKEPSPLWTSPRLKPPMPQGETPRRQQFAEDSLCTTQRTSRIEQRAFCVGQPPNALLVGKQPTDGTGTRVGLVGFPATESADAGCGQA